MVHYIVSRFVARELGVGDLNMFLVGSVLAPDTGNKEDGSYCKLHYMEYNDGLCGQGKRVMPKGNVSNNKWRR